MRDLDDEARQGFAREDGVQLREQRRSAQRLPSGTLRIHGEDKGGCIPIMEAELLSERDKAIFRLMNGEVMNVIRFGVEENFPVPDEYRQALRRVAKALWGYGPDAALWIEPFLIELEVGRGERLAIEARETDPGSADLFPLAEQVLWRTLRAVERLSPTIELPAWLSLELTFLLLKRFSFSGGGGPLGALAKESIRKLLAHPANLARYLREQTAWADRFAEELGLLEESCVTLTTASTPIVRKLPSIKDAEQATTKERRGLRNAARNYKPCLARVGGRRFVLFENGFVGACF